MYPKTALAIARMFGTFPWETIVSTVSVMATSFFYIYAMATSFFYIYIDIYITFTNWRSVQSFYWTPFVFRLQDVLNTFTGGWCQMKISIQY